jgi:hypothetical protein
MAKQQNPKEQAQEYKEQQAPELPPRERERRTPEQWRDLISQRIEEALRDGAFDNLRNRGKPIDPRPDPLAPADMQMANTLLKNNELVPAWIADRRELLAAIERFQAQMQAGSAAHSAALAAAPAGEQEALAQRWTTQVARWRQEAAALNRRIDAQNFRQPAFLEILKVRVIGDR